MLNWDSPVVENADIEQQFDYLRSVRNAELVASDWAMAPDAPTDKTVWATYRQALRDFPATWEQSEIADFPVSPDYVEPVVVETPVEGDLVDVVEEPPTDTIEE